MKIGITGATGFVGSHLIRHLSKEGHQIIAYGRKNTPPESLKEFADYEIWDLDSSVTPDSFNGDVFIHTAGYVEFWGSYKDMYKTNVEGTLKALEMAKKAKHFIYISSASVYGSLKEKKNISENARYAKQYANNYGLTKSEAEKVIIKNAHIFERVTIIRPHAIYGPGDRTLIPRILASIRQDRAFIIGSGKNKYSITHVGNICYGVSLIIKSNYKGLKIYNLTDQQALSVDDIYKHLFNALNLRVQITDLPYPLIKPLAVMLENVYRLAGSKKSPILTSDLARQFTQESTLSLEKIISELKYNPPYKDTDGFEDLKAWIDSAGGLKFYIDNHKDCWGGNLITY